MRRFFAFLLTTLLIGLCGCQTTPPELTPDGSSKPSTASSEAMLPGDTRETQSLSSTVPSGTETTTADSEKPAGPLDCPEGFRAVTAWDTDFLAVGTGGRMSLIAPDGTQQAISSGTDAALHAVAVLEGRAYAVGDAGTLVVYDGRQAAVSAIDPRVNLCAVVVWKDMLFVGGSDGALFRLAPDGEAVRLDVSASGTVTGLTASEARLLVVTDRGEILTSENGADWTCLHYRQAYHTEVSFTGALWTDGLFYACGRRTDGTPLLVQSTMGGVWAERTLDMLNGQPADLSALVFGGIAWDGRQAYVACNDGRLLTLPDCAECNQLQTIADANLTAAVCHSGRVAVVGEGFCAVVVDTEAVRQYRISPETAYQKQQQGAQIIDVRDAAEYAERHIRGSMSLPLGELSNTLPGRLSDRSATLIFYCTKGMRSQAAVEQAQALGYTDVYSLGAMDDWPYAFETGN